MFRGDFVAGSQECFDPVLRPQQHLAEAQTSQVDPPLATLTMRRHLAMQLHPE
jgi:hypothetical protein